MSERIDVKPIGIGLLGKGTVGNPVARELQMTGENQGLILRRILVTDPQKHLHQEDNTYRPEQFTTEPDDMLDDPEIDIVVELMGGLEPAGRYDLKAIRNGKGLVTANKALLAAEGKTIFDAARAHQVDVGYEASVAGKIPIMSLLRHFDGEHISQILGIFNGTSNFILTRMFEESMTYDTAVSLAKEKGYAEKDESRDVLGEDAADKGVWVASLVYNKQFDRKMVRPTGIDIVNLQDMKIAERLGMGKGYAIKPLVRIMQYNGGEVEISVSPALISKDSPLSRVRNERNGIQLDTELGSSIVIDGPGAGGEATASAVLADIRRLARNRRREVVDDLPTLDANISMLDPNLASGRWYLRLNFRDREGIFEDYGRILRANHLSAQHSIQDEESDGREFIPDYDTLKSGQRGDVTAAMRQIEEVEMVEGTPYVLPIWG